MALPNSNKRKVFDGRYEVIAIVGRGSDSVVYHARHAGSPTQEVALKVLLSQKEKASLTERLRKEALTLVSCRHRYVVRLDDFHSIEDLCYLSMEYAPEGDLRKYVTKKGAPLSPVMAERFLRQSLEALDFVHATGVLHRDVKPDNILVMNEREIRLADFGLALLPGDEPSVDDLQAGVGSFEYLPPEVLEGTSFDQRSDLYALGLSFYEMITGKHPFEGVPLLQQMNVRADGEIPALVTLPLGVSQHLSDVITTLLRRLPDDRFSNALEALNALNNPDFTNESRAKNRVAPAVSTARPTEEPRPAKRVERSEATSGLASQVGSAAAVTQFGTGSTAFKEELTPDPLFDPTPAPAQPATSTPVASAANSDRPRSTQVVEPDPSATSHNLAPVLEDAIAAAQNADTTPSQVSDPSERVSQPTEKIDLERIKEIIDKDARQKADLAKRRATQSTKSLTASARAARSQSGTDLQSSNKVAGSGISKSGSIPTPSIANRAIDAFLRVPHNLRPVVVGLGAAVATILLVSLVQIFRSGDSGGDSAGDANTTASNASSSEYLPTATSDLINQAAESTTGQGAVEVQFPQIPGGLYAGEIAGVIPGLTSPFTLISLPKQGMVTVIVGIEGWTPVMVPTTSPDGTISQPLVVRTNGVILNINGAGSSDILEGTFANAVTGETGGWKVKRVS